MTLFILPLSFIYPSFIHLPSIHPFERHSPTYFSNTLPCTVLSIILLSSSCCFFPLSFHLATHQHHVNTSTPRQHIKTNNTTSATQQHTSATQHHHVSNTTPRQQHNSLYIGCTNSISFLSAVSISCDSFSGVSYNLRTSFVYNVPLCSAPQLQNSIF